MPAELEAAPGPVRSAPDQGILAALRAGDERTFEDLFHRHCPAMKRVARSYVRSDAVAEEIVQETWLAILTGIDRFEGRCALGTWMFSILINQARTHNNRERKATPFSAISPVGPNEPAVDADRFQNDDDAWPGHWATPPRPWQKPERRALSLEARELLKQALSRLPARQRLVVGLRDVDGLSSAEVCGLLELTRENERVLLHRGRSRLRAVLDTYVDGIDA